ncbi:MAG: 50S ribosomal protein L25 [Sphaerochaeta sp.]|jgi:large subunit ribosomal protein L25
MSDNRSLKAVERKEDFGSAGSRRLLRSGRIPAVIYGKQEHLHISLDAHEFTNKMRHFSETALLKVQVGRKKHECLMKAYQEDLVRGIIKHVDFYEITQGQVLRAMVSISLQGSPVGTREGGVLEQLLYEVEIECLPKDLPEVLTADVSELQINENLALSDIELPEGVKILSDLEAVVASVRTVREEVEETEEDELEVEVAEATEEEEE